MLHSEYTRRHLGNESEYKQMFFEDIVLQFFAERFFEQELGIDWTPDQFWQLTPEVENATTLANEDVLFEFNENGIASLGFSPSIDAEAYEIKVDYRAESENQDVEFIQVGDAERIQNFDFFWSDNGFSVRIPDQFSQINQNQDNILSFSEAGELLYRPTDSVFTRMERRFFLNELDEDLGARPFVMRVESSSDLNTWTVLPGSEQIIFSEDQLQIYNHDFFAAATLFYRFYFASYTQDGGVNVRYRLETDERNYYQLGQPVDARIALYRNGAFLSSQDLTNGTDSVSITFQGNQSDSFALEIENLSANRLTVEVEDVKLFATTETFKSAKICSDGVESELSIALLDYENEIDSNIGIYEITIPTNDAINSHVYIEVGEDCYKSEPFRFTNDLNRYRKLKPRTSGLKLGLFWYPTFTPHFAVRGHFSGTGTNEAEIVEGQRRNFALRPFKQIVRTFQIFAIPEYLCHQLDAMFSFPVQIDGVWYVKTDDADFSEEEKSGLYNFEISIRRTNFDDRVLVDFAQELNTGFLIGSGSGQFLIGIP